MQLTGPTHVAETLPGKRVGRYTTLAVVCLAQFLTVLDFQSISLALPALQAALEIGPATLQWVISAQALAFGGLLLLTGRTTSLIGRRRSFVLGLVLFGLGALVCGFAPNTPILLAGRVTQGIGGAVITPAALSLVSATFTAGPERARALGIWGAVAPVGGSVGILLGGWLIGRFGWPWVFWITLPIVALALALSPLLEADRREPTARLDVAGAAIGTLGITLLVYGLGELQRAGLIAWTALGSLVLAAALLIAFLALEHRVQHPLIPLRIFRQHTVAGANLLTIVLAATTNTPIFFLTLYLQQVKGFSPLVAGLMFLPTNLTIVVGSSLGSALTTHLGQRRTMFFGMATISAGLLLLARLAVGSTFVPDVLPGLLLFGLGLGVMSVAVNVAGVAQIDHAEHGLAWGLLNTSARIGTALGLALLVTVATARTDSLSGGHSPSDAAVVAGIQAAFLVAAAVAAIGALAACALFRPVRLGERRQAQHGAGGRGARGEAERMVV